jgi:hypothetical protein
VGSFEGQIIPNLPPINLSSLSEGESKLSKQKSDTKSAADDAARSDSEGKPSAEDDEEEEEGAGNDDATDTFPFKLYRMLADAEAENKEDIVSFLDHGRSFAIHKPREFVAEIMPRYFTTSRMSSFQRQLNLYGFRRITEGRDKGGYYHENFVKGKKSWCSRIKRKKTSVKAPPNFFPTPINANANQSLSVRQLLADGHVPTAGFPGGMPTHMGSLGPGGMGGGSMNSALATAIALEQQRKQQQMELMHQLLRQQEHAAMFLGDRSDPRNTPGRGV